ncbi:unnamed protein product [Trifolium pratense]|uniref:Uncharacterized protein n=1 Tax=Trifolium pratense TaxID=57577 RepID=A0ACB0IXA5_TRIPR|nr:unnamed protein product [Trifolium pratense]
MAAAVSVVVAVAVKTVVAPELGFELRADPADSKAEVEMRLSHMNNSTVISLIKSMNYLALRTIKANAQKNSAALSISGIKLVTRWAIYIIEYACESLKLNHPETQVRNKSTENFLNLIKEGKSFATSLYLNRQKVQNLMKKPMMKSQKINLTPKSLKWKGFFLFAMTIPMKQRNQEPGLYFKVQWKCYDSSYDTREPIEGVRCMT